MVSQETRELYCSPNGDSWHLVREPESGRVFVLHFADVASGGQITDIEFRHFLLAEHRGPEHGVDDIAHRCTAGVRCGRAAAAGVAPAGASRLLGAPVTRHSLWRSSFSRSPTLSVCRGP
jgi:hypothetical protein